jgi:cytosine/adenosine deaminase-related metal-dependent hydrolase
MKKLIIPKEIVTANSSDLILTGHAVEISDGVIISLPPLANFDLQNYDGEIFNLPELTLTPGFVQTHIHLCQTLFRGLADDLELLDWLQKRIFPLENAHTKDSLRVSVQLGLNELLLGGTTTILDMGTLRHQEVIFEELSKSGIRAFAGNCMIDRNDLYPDFKVSTKESLQATFIWASEFHNSNGGKIKYGFAPRFVLSCTEELLKETKEMMRDFEGSLFHTHSSENKKEVESVRNLTGKENVEYFDSIGILDDHTVLAHCIHLNENEIAGLKKRNARVAHCPSSNLKLGSGIANIPRYLREGISVSLGADGAPCNNSLCIFKEMNLAALIQKPIHGPTSMDAKTVFKLATIDGAKALHLENEVGSIEAGKRADFVLLDLNGPQLPLSDERESVYSKIVYSASQKNVRSVFIDGKPIVQNGQSTLYDSDKLVADGKSELKKILNKSNCGY